MKTLGLIVLLGVAASALPADLPAAASDKVNFRCQVNNEFDVLIKERKAPFYLCASEEGDHFLLAASIDGLETNFETILSRGEAVKLRDLHQIIVGAPARPKRSPQFQGGFGGGGAGSQASANAGSFSGGGGGGFGGLPGGGGGGFGGAGSYSNAAASSNAGGGGFGGGYNPFFYG